MLKSKTSPLLLALLLSSAPARAEGPDGAKVPAKAETKAEPKKPEAKSQADDVDDLMQGEDVKTTIGQPAPTVTPGTKTGPKVLVLPFQPVFRSVAPNKIQTANELLLKELDHKDTFTMVRGGVHQGELWQPSLDAANKAAEAALKAEAGHEISKAIEERRRVIAELEKNLAAVAPDDYVLAHHYLARALMWAAQDKEAHEVIEAAARMRAGIALEPAEFSRLYRRWFQKAAEKVVAEKGGDLLVTSALPGATITLDGRPMDVAPVLLKKVAPGKHLVSAQVEGVPPFAAVVQVAAGKKNEFNVVFANTVGGAGVGVVADALTQNTMSKKAVDAAAQAGKEAGAAFVLTGALSKDEDRFKVFPFVVEVASGKLAALDVASFDLELLTAESDVLRVVQNASAVVNGFQGELKSQDPIDKKRRGTTVVNEVAAAPSLVSEEAQAEQSPKEKKARAVFQPLKGGTIKIKDDEED